VVVGVNTAEEGNPREKASAFQQKHALTYPILLDETGEVRKAYRVDGFPTNVIIDRDGTVRYIQPGFNPGAVSKTLQELMGR
jgi:peroxiredoxin